MARKSKKPEAPAGAPDWLVTYGDCMTLLLCFFVIIVSMSEIKEDEKFMKVLESLRVAFGGYQGAAGPVPITNEPSNVLIQRLIELEMPKERQKPGDTQDEAIEGKNWRVTNIRDGIQVVVGGGISFDRFSATLKAEAQERIAGAGEILRGYRTKIIVKGHTTREALPEDSLYDSKRDLSYARAKAVADALVAAGIAPERLILVACADTEPLVAQAYTEERRALNRRVEILVTEDLVEEYAGSRWYEEESSNGG